MANATQNSSLISKEFLFRLKNTLSFTMSVNRQYNKLFQSQGTKPGVTINIRKPPLFSGRRGQRAVPEGITDNTVPLTINTQYGQDVAISSQEEALNLQDYSEQVVQPAVDKIAQMIDSDGLFLAYQEVPDFVGVPGSPATLNSTFIAAGTTLSDNSVPTGKLRYAVVNPSTEGGLVGTQATQFNNQADVSEQNREGAMGRAFGLSFGMDQNVYTHTVGALGGAALVNVSGGVADGATSVAFDGGSNNVTGYYKKGDSISFALAYKVNLMSKVTLTTLKRFCVAADCDTNGSGQGTVYLTEAIRLTGAYQNVSALPADNAAITCFGHASTYAGLTSAQCLAYHRDLITFATVDLYVPRGAEMGARANSEDLNLSVRHIRYMDYKEDQLVDRFDVLGGWKVLRPEMGCRILSM